MEEIIFNVAVVVGAVITCVLSAVAYKISSTIQLKCDTETKKSLARTVVYACEQMYQALDGEDKLAMAEQKITNLLESYGIDFDGAELRLLIESAVKQMNDENASNKMIGTLFEPEIDEVDDGIYDNDNKNIYIVSSVEKLPENPEPGLVYLVGTDIGKGFTQYESNADGIWIPIKTEEV